MRSAGVRDHVYVYAPAYARKRARGHVSMHPDHYFTPSQTMVFRHPFWGPKTGVEKTWFGRGKIVSRMHGNGHVCGCARGYAHARNDIDIQTQTRRSLLRIDRLVCVCVSMVLLAWCALRTPQLDERRVSDPRLVLFGLVVVRTHDRAMPSGHWLQQGS